MLNLNLKACQHMYSSITSRMNILIEAKLPKYGRFQQLEKLTKIKNATWQTWGRGRQRPTDRMIEAIACLWPEHAYWLVTGDELQYEGMTNPSKKYGREIQTIQDLTARVLSTRQTIRNELIGAEALHAVDDDGNITDKDIEIIATKFSNMSIEIIDQSDHEITKKNFRAKLDEQWENSMKQDSQLQELERTRHRLISQILTKQGTAI